jgi:hypothetical protein
VTLRTWEREETGKKFWHYELVEVKALLEEAAKGKLEMRQESAQNPKPGSCTVKDGKGNMKFALYFDGGHTRLSES